MTGIFEVRPAPVRRCRQRTDVIAVMPSRNELHPTADSKIAPTTR